MYVARERNEIDRINKKCEIKLGSIKTLSFCGAIKTFSGSIGSSIIATVADVFIFEGIFIIPICFDLVLGLFSKRFT